MLRFSLYASRPCYSVSRACPHQLRWMTAAVKTMAKTSGSSAIQKKTNSPKTSTKVVTRVPGTTPRVTRAPSSTQTKIQYQQCAGTRRDGRPCSRNVPVDPGDTKTTTKMTPVYCHDHQPRVAPVTTATMATSTAHPPIESVSTTMDRPAASITRAPPSKLYDCWALWINKNIPPRRRWMLQQEIMKPLSPKDEAGYLYAYHLIQGPRMSTDTYCYFKIGRSTNPTRRMYQVMNQCGYQPRLLDVMPAWTRTGATLQQQQRKTRPGKAERWTKCPLSHRVERLIHVELASLYPSTGGFKCKACGSTHREWFRVKRPMVLDDTGAQRPMTDHEVWLEKIRPVMLHWVRYGVVASATLTSHNT